MASNSEPKTPTDPSDDHPLLNTNALTFTMPMHMYPLPTTQRPLRAKRRQVKNACTNCQKACKKCDDARPCLRCIKYAMETECVDSKRKERKKGLKRGPYKKRGEGPYKKRDFGRTSGGTEQLDEEEELPMPDEGSDNQPIPSGSTTCMEPVRASGLGAGPSYHGQYVRPPLPPPAPMKQSEARATTLSLHPAPAQRYYHSQLYVVYPPPLPPPRPQVPLPQQHPAPVSRALPTREYPPPPVSHYQHSSPAPGHIYHQYNAFPTYYPPSYVVHPNGDLQQQPLMLTPGYPYMALQHPKPEGSTYFEGHGGVR
ncbi:hypothetical protein BDP27DRAFT_1420036 [Rhodocollybia butyracea]|uniref:Zn(2)-C6 fungal-type domain-containing protein n=1 Tax=Rhodocollybia butyracea TaxID=206335 RepID=A0A9P5PVV3_9AGAR|nr:hypothetical protein BDP27DRAFT_1420036 [Rhodocollybia butyracea]